MAEAFLAMGGFQSSSKRVQNEGVETGWRMEKTRRLVLRRFAGRFKRCPPRPDCGKNSSLNELEYERYLIITYSIWRDQALFAGAMKNGCRQALMRNVAGKPDFGDGNLFAGL
ncbi:hypothetical protein [Desulfatibacillum alkenivorans]|jgi:hypothetical protein|uniref:hypothetical protein n=1 Tax=Desulfatibacillum alkenivorans TaxID=259354 RepID=UPI000937598C|nr:hypothetical protein [Desulfatibacillum alkenivorans]